MTRNGRDNRLACWVVAFTCAAIGTTVVVGSPLFDRGYTVLPAPQNVSLRQKDAEFTPDWRVTLEQGVAPTDVAVASFKEGLADRFHLRIKPAGEDRTATRIVSLSVQPGSIVIGQAADRDRSALAEQASPALLGGGTVKALVQTSAFLKAQGKIDAVLPDYKAYVTPRFAQQAAK